jgi:hypothetical protein
MCPDRVGLVALAVALAGCSGGAGKDGPPPASGVLDLAAAPLAGMPTVLEVTWRTEEPSTGRVAFGLDGATDRVTPEQEEGTEHRALLVGLPQEQVVTLRVDGEPASDELDATTGAIPGAVPQFSVSGEGFGHFTTTVTMLGDRARIVLLDPEGRVTWVYEDPRSLSVFRARLAHDGTGIVYLSSIVRGGPSPDSALIRVDWDGTERAVIPVPDLAHDFVELADGTLVALAYETRGEVLGNALIEIPPGGSPRPTWSTWDCFDPVAHESDDPAQGWTHANALDYDADRDQFLVGMRNLNGITAVDRSTGACAWTLGGIAGDVSITGEQRFRHQHQFERTPDGLVVFDNDGSPGQESRILEFSLDPAAKTARVLGTLEADPPLFSFILGDVHRTDDGSTLVVWSEEGTMDRLDATGARTFRLEAPDGVLFGFAQWVLDPYVIPE